MIRSSFLRAPLLVRPALRSTSVGRAVVSLQNYSRTPSWSSTLRPSSTAAAVPAEQKLASLTPSQHDLPDTASNPPLKSSIQDRLPSWLRPYQVEVIEACVDALDRGLQRIGVSSPTGSGKTVMFTHLIPLLLSRGEPGGSILVLVGNIELARQAFATIEKSYPDYIVELEQGSSMASGRADVTIATYQTLRQDSRLAKYDPRRFKGIIVDEAHHAAAPSYIKLLSYFNSDVKSFDEEPTAPHSLQAVNVPIIGFTATFSRHDQLALSRVFQEIVYHQDVIDMLEAGWLAPARFTTVKANLDLSNVTVTGSTDDFSATSLAAVMNTPAVNSLIVGVYLDRARDRQSTLVFCVDLAHVADMTAAFRAAGVDARFVTGNTKESERKALVEAFKAGEFPVMVNCQLFTEGTDIPNIDCIIVARPTRSRNLFSQMIGRGLRHAPGKADCRIIDLVDNVNKVGGLISAPTLFGLEVGADVEDETLETLRERAERRKEELQRQEKESKPEVQLEEGVSYLEDDDPFRLDDTQSTNARASSKYAWVACGGDKYFLDVLGTEYFSIIKENSLYQIRHAFHLPAGEGGKRKKAFQYAKWTVYGRTETLEQGFRAGDALLEKMVSRAMLPNLFRWADWRRRAPTPAQLLMLERMGYTDARPQSATGDNNKTPVVSKYTSGQVASILTAMKQGAKGRSSKIAKQNTRAEKVKDKEARRQAAQAIKIGPLGSSLA